MARKKKHKDVVYEVYDASDRRSIEYDGDAALARAAMLAMSTGSSRLDVIVSSVAGARFIGGDDAVEQYKEDPEASVFDRFDFKCNNVGRVP